MSRQHALASSTSSLFFLVSEVMFQFTIASLWKDCCFRVAFEFPKSRNTLLDSIRPFQMPRGRIMFDILLSTTYPLNARNVK